MHLEVVQLAANALASGLYGVNAVLDSIPRSNQRRPPNVQVYDETRDGWVSRLELSEEPPDGVVLPAVVVVLGGPISWGDKGRPTRHNPQQSATSVTIGAHYLTREADTALGVTDSILTLRAVRNVFVMLSQPALVDARILHDVRLESLVETQYARLFTPMEDVILAGSVLTTWTARESLSVYTP